LVGELGLSFLKWTLAASAVDAIAIAKTKTSVAVATGPML
jgi:hypothetical protein